MKIALEEIGIAIVKYMLVENRVSGNHIYLFEQCISGLFLVKSDKAKVFGFAVLASVNRSLEFNNLTVTKSTRGQKS